MKEAIHDQKEVGKAFVGRRNGSGAVGDKQQLAKRVTVQGRARSNDFRLEGS